MIGPGPVATKRISRPFGASGEPRPASSVPIRNFTGNSCGFLRLSTCEIEIHFGSFADSLDDRELGAGAHWLRSGFVGAFRVGYRNTLVLLRSTATALTGTGTIFPCRPPAPTFFIPSWGKGAPVPEFSSVVSCPSILGRADAAIRVTE
jgi:hypothetical protein